MEIISGVYKITNTVTKDFYIGSSKNIKRRWASHKNPSKWKQCPNNQLYLDMKKYGTNKFAFEILAKVEIEKLKEIEQQFIEKLQPTYNSNNAKGRDIERQKEYHKKYQKKYQKTDKRKQYLNEYQNQLCSYNGETLTLCALSKRFQRQGIPHPQLEAKKYLIQ